MQQFLISQIQHLLKRIVTEYCSMQSSLKAVKNIVPCGYCEHFIRSWDEECDNNCTAFLDTNTSQIATTKVDHLLDPLDFKEEHIEKNCHRDIFYTF